DRQGEGNALGNLGNAYFSLGQYQTAIDFYEQNLAIAREIGDRVGEAGTLNNQGIALFYTGQFSQAESTLRQSLEVFESLRTGLSDDQLISIADTQAQAYANLERALTAQNKTAEALAITERGRGRAFVLQLASRLATEAERAALEASPVAQAPTVAEIQQIARDTNTTLVTYSQIFDRALYIWVVQPSGNIEFRSVEFEGSDDGSPAVNPIAAIDGPVYRSATPESELTALVNDSRATVIVEGVGTDPQQLQDLHQILIDPIADLLPDDPEANVAFIPQGNLFLVPFAALQDENGTYLIENHTILTAPSIQVFGLANNAANEPGSASLLDTNPLVVGNPVMPTVSAPTASGEFADIQLSDLPGAEREAVAIGNFFQRPALIGDQATEARIKQLLPDASLIHLATHGLLEYGIPESSGVLDLPGAIALTPGDGEDGLLTSAEILSLDLQADLAILSACDTGRGRITGDGVVGLSRALITAGVPSVMVSLWAVPDAPTAELMTEFYNQLAQGQDNAQALRQSMLITMQQHPEPRNWAAFTLLGAAE
ncbi:MAG: CHAT domain-containing tetratricopeptide repeat protein, partial [Elainellaceae cyanobacterium]